MESVSVDDSASDRAGRRLLNAHQADSSELVARPLRVVPSRIG